MESVWCRTRKANSLRRHHRPAPGSYRPCDDVDFFPVNEARIHVSSLPECDGEQTSGLFSCSEPGCHMVFKKFSEFENHLDVGEHRRVRGGGSETVYDKVRRDYAEKFRTVDCNEESSRTLVAHRDDCSVAVVSSVVVMSSHLITNRMRFYFFQSKCVVNVSSACHFPTRGGMQCKIVRLSLSFPRSKFENFMGYSCFMGLSLMPFGTLRIVERLIFLLRF